MVNEFETNGSENSRSTFLKQVESIIVFDRPTLYGLPENNFQNIVNLWNAYLCAKDGNKAEPSLILTVLDVALMMDLMKTARLATNPTHLDSWLDKAGYTACGGSLLIE